MLMCDQTVTLIHSEYDAALDADVLTCTPLANASWYAKKVIRASDKGLVSADVYRARIPVLPPGVTVLKDDYLVRGSVSGVTSIADLAPYEHFKVATVGDNRRGHLQHWMVSSL